MTRIIAEIPCVDDDGTNYLVHIFQEFRTVKHLSGHVEEIPGMKFAALAGSQDRINVLDSELKSFKVVKNDRIIRSTLD